MRRRDFLGVLAGAVTATPIAAQAQQDNRMRRIGVLIPASADDSIFQARFAAFLQGLQQAGWTIGQNARIEIRWARPNDSGDIRRNAEELAALKPDVILAHGVTAVGPLLQATHTIPIIFPVATDPVAAGFVDSLSRPGGNATGFMTTEYSTSGKWLELLKEIAPALTRVAVLRNAATPSGPAQFGVIQSVATSLGVDVIPVNMREADIERALLALARAPNGGVIVTSGAGVQFHRDLIVALTRQHKLPVVYYEGAFVRRGGLLSYGPDLVHQYRLAAGYVDRILKGEQLSDLPVQSPIKYELVINLKTAKALGLTVPPTLLARADEVIE
jgi:putative ABC transport system substrate-binding protein